MPDFEPTRPSGPPSGLQHDLDELARNSGASGTLTRLASLGPSLTQDLKRFERDGRAADLLEVLAAAVRHARNLTLQLSYGENVLPLTLFPAEGLAHCPLDLQKLDPRQLATLSVLQVEPAMLLSPANPDAIPADERKFFRPLPPLLWDLALRGQRSILLPELAGAAVYRVSPAFDLGLLETPPPLRSAIRKLRHHVANLGEIGHWPGMDRDLATRLINALYLQVGLMVSRSHPAALDDSRFGEA